MNLNKFVEEVHANAVAHGWWDEDRSATELIALIHSEWSEALEEYRAGRPMVWFPVNCDCQVCGDRPAMNADICSAGKCDEGHKPEGIAVELMDGCIRIFDMFGRYGIRFPIGTCKELEHRVKKGDSKLSAKTPLPELICILHMLTSKAPEFASAGMRLTEALKPLQGAVGIAMWWVRANGVDPEEILVEKHEYNKTRPYRHGGKKC